MEMEGVNSATCTYSDNQSYNIQWKIDKNDIIHFQLQYRNFPSNVNAWTGIAFGESMIDGLDAIIVKVLNGRVYITDEYVQGYGPSWPDQQQDITTQTTRLSNGVLRAVFSRPILAGEIGVDKTLTGCTTWNFITGIGMAYETHVSKHTRHPETRTICLDNCRI